MDEFVEYVHRYATSRCKTLAEAMQDALPWIVGQITYGLSLEELGDYSRYCSQ